MAQVSTEDHPEPSHHESTEDVPVVNFLTQGINLQSMQYVRVCASKEMILTFSIPQLERTPEA